MCMPNRHRHPEVLCIGRLLPRCCILASARVQAILREDAMRRTCLILTLGFVCTFHQVRAQPYPSHPITMVVPFAAGAPVDTVGRVVADRMSASLGQPIILENVS